MSTRVINYSSVIQLNHGMVGCCVPKYGHHHVHWVVEQSHINGKELNFTRQHFFIQLFFKANNKENKVLY